MPEGLIDSAAQSSEPTDRRIYGVTLAQVVNNVDMTGLGRVQIILPWLPGFFPWARVAALSAGALVPGVGYGTYFIPQIGAEVLVAFNQGDVREPFVLGCLWNGLDRPPAGIVPTDPVAKRVICTPMLNEIRFDDILQQITITTNTQQKVTLNPGMIQLSTTGGTATITLDVAGGVSIQAARSIDLTAPTITIQGGTVDVKGTASTNIGGGAACNVQAALVKIN